MKVKTPCQLFLSVAFWMTLCGGAEQAWGATATTTSLAVTSGGSAVTTVKSGSVVTLTATVNAGSTPVARGQVNFCDATAAYCTDIHLLGTEQLTSAGTAALKLIPGIGSHSYKAVFVGTNSDAASSSSASALTVTGSVAGGPPYATSTALTQFGSAGNYTLTATVIGSVDGRLASPTGTISFLDTSNGNAVLGTAPLAAGPVGLSFLNSSTPAPGSYPASFMAVGDFNGDGKADLAVVNQSNNTVTILLGNGNGTFTATAASPATGVQPTSIAVGDFNGDGIPDLAVTNALNSTGATGSSNAPNGTVTILLGNGDGTFTPTAKSPEVGQCPISVAAGDFNLDGIPDLAVVDYGCPYLGPSYTVTILLGNGDGTFTKAPNASVWNPKPFAIAVGDFNGDGIPDLAVPNSYNNNLTILLGNGDGTFTWQAANPAVGPPTGNGPENVVVADFNGDGKADLAVPNYEDGTVTILLGNGDGTFTPTATSPATGNGPVSVAIGDFNGDGIPDLAVMNQGYGAETEVTPLISVTVFLGNGDGTFRFAASPALEGEPDTCCQGIVAADFNGDGKPDLAAVNIPYDTVWVLLTQWTQTATASASGIFPVGPGPDLVEASYPGDSNYSSSISGSTILFNPPKTTTTLAVSSGGTPVTSVASGSLVTLTATVMAGSTAVKTGQVKFCDATTAYCTDIHLLGAAQLTSGGTAELQLVPAIGSHSYKAVFVGANADAASSSSDSALTVTGKYPTTTTITMGGVAGDYTLAAAVAGVGGTTSPTGTVSFLDTSDGNYLLETAALATSPAELGFLNSSNPAAGSLPTSIAVADFNGDGKADLAVANSVSSTCPTVPCPESDTVTILLGNGDGTFTATPVSPATGAQPLSIAVGDFNGDGKPDLAVANSGSNTVTILLGNGDGTFTRAASPATGNTPEFVAVGDFNGDGKQDLAVANSGSNTVTILLGNGDGTFTAAASPATGSTPYSIAVGDFDGNGKADLAVANYGSNTVTILLANGDGTFRPGPESPGTGGLPESVAVGDFNGDGKADLAVVSFNTNEVRILLGNGDGTFMGTASPATLSSPTFVAVGDFNGDGIPDLVVASWGSFTCCPIATTGLTVLLGNGDGTFTEAQVGPEPGFQPNYVAVGDFNGDGKPDLAVANSSGEGSTVGIANVLLTQLTQTATATASGISPLGTGSHLVEASYPGNISYSASVSGTTVSLSGTGTATPVVSLSTPSLSFGSQPTSMRSAAQTETITNTGTANLAISTVTISGTNASDFAKSADTCTGATVIPNGTCTVSVTFTPSATGSRSASLNFTDNASNSPQTVSLSGTGTAVLVITASSGSMTYGGTAPTIAPSYSGFVNGDSPASLTTTPTCSTTASSSTPVGTYTGADTCSGAVDPNYTFTYVAGNVTISKAALTITASSASMNYGGTPPTVTPIYSTFAGSDTVASLTTPPTCSTTATSSTPLGTYTGADTCSGAVDPNYSFTYVAGNVTVNKATPVITWATPAAITYGATLSSTQLNATASVPGTFVYSPAAGTAPATGTDTLSATFTPTNTTDYTTATQTVSLTVSKATPTITWATPAGITYGATLSSTQLNATASVPGTFIYSPAAGTTPAGGTDTLSVTFTPTDTTDYNTATATVSLAVADFTFTAPSGSSGTAAPGQSATYTLSVGGQGGLSGMVTFTCTGAPSEATCTVSPNPVTVGSSATNVTVTVTTTAPSVSAPRSRPFPPPLSPGRWGLWMLALVLAAMAWAITRRKEAGVRRWQSTMLSLAGGLLLALALAGCGGGGSSGSTPPPSNPGTPAGTFPLTVTGTAGSGSSAVSNSVTLTLIVT